MGLSMSPGSVCALGSIKQTFFIHLLEQESFIIADDGLINEVGEGSDPLVFLLCILGLSLPQLQELPCLLELALLGLEDDLAVFILIEMGLDEVRLVKDLVLSLCALLGC